MVVPRIVRFPVSCSLLGATSFTPVDSKVILGCLATSKKASERRCLSRAGSLVSTLAASIDTCTELFVKSSRSTTIFPSNLVKRPGTRLNRWRMVKPTALWTGSMA